MMRARRFLGAELRRLHTDEGGSSLVFASITFFGLALCTMMVYTLGMISGERLRVQNAADAAAYSGAVIEANNLNVMGQLNDGMAYIHYNLLRYVIDCTIYETLRLYEDHHTRVGRHGFFPPQFDTRGGIMPSIDPRPGQANQYAPSAENTVAPGWVMLGDTAEFQQRSRQANEGIRNFPRLIDQGRLWLEDLVAAQRALLEATPTMVRNHARAIARQNGATHIAFSDDLDLAFRVETPVGGPIRQAGFYEMRQNPDAPEDASNDGLSHAMTSRYAWGVAGTGSPADLARARVGGDTPIRATDDNWPGWFNPSAGRSRDEPAGYSQVRLCWNRNDWGHDHRIQNQPTSPNSATDEGAPNGHWHARHRHIFQLDFDGSIHHTFHGNMESGVERPACGHTQDAVEQELSSVSGGTYTDGWRNGEHAWVNCPTCGVRSHSGDYTEVGREQARYGGDLKSIYGARNASENGSLNRGSPGLIGLHLWSGDDIDGWPRPVGMRHYLLRSGITVATWRPGSGIGGWYPASPWGTVAVASAQVGYWINDGTTNEVRLLRELDTQRARFTNMGASTDIEFAEGADDQAPRPWNLFFSSNPNDGMFFGARLVPVGRELTWFADPTLDRVLGPSQASQQGGSGGWTLTDGNGTPQAPPGINTLSTALDVGNMNDLTALRESIWH